MEYQESYRGEPIVITTERRSDGRWTATAEHRTGGRRTVVSSRGATFDSEEDARQHALTEAVNALDRARTATGKP